MRARRLVAELDGVRGIVFDVDGVLCERDLPIGRAADTISRIAAAGIPFRLLTNTTSKSRRLLAKNLRGAGFPLDAEQIFAPPHAAGEYLRAKKASAFLLVQDGAIEDFAGVDQGEAEADCVVVGDLGDAWTFEMLNRAFRILHRGDAELIGLGRTRYWEAPTGLQLDCPRVRRRDRGARFRQARTGNLRGGHPRPRLAGRRHRDDRRRHPVGRGGGDGCRHARRARAHWEVPRSRSR